MQSPARRLVSSLRIVMLLVAMAGPLAAPATAADDFEAKLARIQKAINENPKGLPEAVLRSCMRQLEHALTLYDEHEYPRAERSLRYCFEVLDLPEERPKSKAPTKKVALHDRAQKEMARALALQPDVDNGLEIYRSCAACHKPEGWGYTNGLVPQIAGQHRTVVIKQLADMRAGHRANVLMEGYPTTEALKDAQALADVAAYVDTLEISVANGKGPGDSLDTGARIYAERCADCHGPSGEGNGEKAIPRIQAQHFEYLLRELDWIRSGQRANGHPEMKRRIADLSEAETRAVLDYVSRLEPPPELQAPPDWHNPDFED